MAISLERFSIREYASKIRAHDAAKCWPFREDSSDAAACAILPPITVAKFRWWADELDLLRSKQPTGEDDSKSAQVPESQEQSEIPDGKSGSAVVDESAGASSSRVVCDPTDDGLDVRCPIREHWPATTVGRLSHRGSPPREELKRRRETAVPSPSKSKVRIPKKRSIVEIFAVSPQIQTLDFDDEEDEDSGPNDCDVFGRPEVANSTVLTSNEKNKTKNGNDTRCRLKAGSAAVTSNIKEVKFPNFVKKGKKGKLDQPSQKKASPTFYRNVHGSTYGMKSSKSNTTAVSAHKKKPSLKFVPVEKIRKIPASKSIASTQNPVPPIHGILKNQSKAILKRRSSTLCKSQGQVPVNSCSRKLPGRHVRFSEEDDIPGATCTYFGSIGSSPKSTCSLFSDDIATSFVNERFAEGIEESNVIEVSESDDDISGDKVDESEDQPVVETELAVGDNIDTLRSLQQHIDLIKEVHRCSDNSVFPNQAAAVGDDAHVFFQGEKMDKHHSSHDAGNQAMPPKPSYAGGECPVPVISDETSGYFHRASCGSGKMINYTWDPPSNVDLMSATENMKLPPPSSPCFTADQLSNQWLPFLPQVPAQTCNVHPSRQQLFCYPSAEESKGQAVVFRERCSDGEFFGLPLNSRGELIQLNSSGRCCFNKQKASHYCPSLSDRALPKSQLKFFPLQNCEKPEFDFPVPSSLCNAEFQGMGGALFSSGGNHLSCDANSELNPENISCPGCRHHGKFKSETECLRNSEHATQPTMRLMGKDVIVGKSSKVSQASDENIWTDKEIVVQHHPANTVVDSFSKRRIENFNEAAAWSSEIPSNQASKSTLQIKAAEAGLAHPAFHRQTHMVSPYGCSIESSNLNARPSFGPPASSSIFNQIPFISCSESSKSGFVGPSFNIQRQMHPNSAEFKFKDGPPHVSKPFMEYPVPRQECQGHAYPVYFHKLLDGHPPWLLHPTGQSETAIPSHPYSHLAGRHNFMKFPCAPHSSAVSHPYNSLSFTLNSKNSSGSEACFLPPLIPVPPGSKPAPMSMSYKSRTKVKGRMKDKPFSLRESDRGSKTMKRLPCRSHKRKLAKLPNLGRRQDSGAFAPLDSKGEVTNDSQCNSRAFRVEAPFASVTNCRMSTHAETHPIYGSG